MTLANRSCVMLSDLCSMQCFKLCTLLLKRPIFRALSVSQYGRSALGHSTWWAAPVPQAMYLERAHLAAAENCYLLMHVMQLWLCGDWVKKCSCHYTQCFQKKWVEECLCTKASTDNAMHVSVTEVESHVKQHNSIKSMDPLWQRVKLQS